MIDEIDAPPRVMTPAELAAHLRVSERTIARMVIDGCPSMLVGSRRRFDLAAVTTWTKERTPCQSAKTPMGVGTQKLASAVDAYTESSRKVQLRVMPSSSKRS